MKGLVSNVNQRLTPQKNGEARLLQRLHQIYADCLIFYFFLASARAINLSISRPSAVTAYFSLISL